MANNSQVELVKVSEGILKGVCLPSCISPNIISVAYDSFMSCFSDPEKGKTTWSREVEYVTQSLSSATPQGDMLRNAIRSNPTSLVNSVKQIAMSGLSLDPTLKQCYLYTFKGAVTLVPSYIGLRDLLVKTGLVKDLEAHPVYKDELFDIEFGVNERLVHKPNPFSDNRTYENMIGCYWRAILPDGTVKFDTMSKNEIEDIRRRSPSANAGPWKTDTIEMSKKTLIRRAFKSLPHIGISDENIKLLKVTMEADDKLFISNQQEERATQAVKAEAEETEFTMVNNPQQEQAQQNN